MVITRERVETLLALRKAYSEACEHALLMNDASERNIAWEAAYELEDAWDSEKSQAVESKNLAEWFAWDLIDSFFNVGLERLIKALNALDVEVTA